jgi:pimeloyl-ACP methyl ester carboxylesterase
MTRSHAFETAVPGFTRRELLRAASLAGLAVTGGLGRSMLRVTDASAAPVPGALAPTPLADQLAWLLDAVNSGGAALTDAEVAEHIAPGLLALVPAAQIIGLVQTLAGGYGALTLQGTTRPQTATQAVALVSAAVGVQLALPIAIEAEAPHRITGLTVYPSPSGDGTPLLPERDGSNGPTTTNLIDVGGRGLYRTDAGSGGPTVVFEAGLGDSAATWSGVIPAIAATTRVIGYDRANTTAGASDPAPTPRTAADAVADLHALLDAADAPAPYVLVGHSVGGLFARLYASTYPDEVAGLVLVDASHEEQDIRRQGMVSPELFAAEQQAVGANAEGIDLAASFAQMREARATTPLSPMPLVVLSAGLDDPAMYPADWPMEAEAQLHNELQSDLAGLVPGGRHVVAEQSGHYIQQRQPDLVVAAIRDVVQAVVDPKS